MPRAIDQSKFNGPDKIQSLDINNPPMIDIPHQEFPKCIYLHPKDKTQEHKSKVVHDKAELDAHVERGWKTKPHIPVAPPEPDADDYESFEVAKGKK